MGNCPSKKKAERANRVIKGHRYSMRLNRDPKNALPVEIITWKSNGIPCEAPSVMKGMGHSYTLSVKILSTGAIADIKNDPNDAGAVFYGAKRATFHEI